MAEFAKYREITARLKKRFTLRKPNFREASESFKKLSHELRDFKEYAGYCMLSAAQCEHNIVGALREQQLGGSNSPNINRPSGSSSSTTATSPKPGSAVSTSGLFSVVGNSSSVGLQRMLHTATLSEFQTLLDTARLFKEGDEVNGAIAAFAHSVQVCPERLLPLVYAEWADMFRSHQRFFEAAEVYLEGGLLRDAIDCLLAGQYFEDAYQCYLELFQLAGNNSSSPNIVGFSRSTSSISAKSTASHQTPSATKPSISLFGRQKTSETNPKSTPTANPSNSLHAPPVGSDGGPFADTEYLTVDDHITLFLLRLYLYDPVKYEYPSPIIPLPNALVQSNPNLKLIYQAVTEEEEMDEPEAVDSSALDQTASSSTSSTSASAVGQSNQSRTNNQFDFSISETFLPFVDFFNSRHFERTISDLIELNMLLETLYLSYRNELRHTIDHDFTNGEDDSSWSSSASSIDSSDNEDDNSEVTRVELLTQTESAANQNIPSEMLSNLSLRRESIEDDPPTTATTTTTKSSTSGNSSTFEKNDLDDFSLRLEQLALQFGSQRSGKSSMSRSRSKCMTAGDTSGGPLNSPKTEQDSEYSFAELDRKMIFQERMLATDGDNDQQLRLQIATKLFPLLNSHQNQLVYLILTNKD